MLQYILALVGFVVGLLLLYFVVWRICLIFTWQPDNFLYQFLKLIQATSLFWGIGVILIGWTIITYHFFQKPLRYLDEVVKASEQLAQPDNKPIVLSDAIKNVQDELNLVREQALRNAMAAKEAE
jgi:two-component system sensor histidine kinase VanS